MGNFYHKVGELDDRVKILEGQVLDLSEMTDGDFLQYDESKSALIPQSVTEVKSLLGVVSDSYSQIIAFTGGNMINASTPITTISDLVLNNSTWTHSATGTYTNVFSDINALSIASVVNNGIVKNGAAIVGFYLFSMGAFGTITLNTYNLSGALADLTSSYSSVYLNILS